MGQPIMAVADLAKSYSSGPVRTLVLNGVGLELGQGEIGVILGLSGSGKSMLINIIGGIHRADGGRAVVDGLVLGELSDRERTDGAGCRRWGMGPGDRARSPIGLAIVPFSELIAALRSTPMIARGSAPGPFSRLLTTKEVDT